MAIPLYGVSAQGGKIFSLDDQSVVKDEAALAGTGGTAFTCRMLTVPFAASAYSRLRRLVQSVPHLGTVTITATPWRDKQDTGQDIVRTVASSDGDLLTIPFSATGSDFQIEVVLSAFTAAAEIGNGEVTLLPRRSQR